MMITFNNLGNLGRLANQMFQYASLKGIARNRGFEFMIPPASAFGTRDLLVRQDGTNIYDIFDFCLLYTSPSPRDRIASRMPSSA